MSKEKLLDWFKHNKRILIFRQNRNAYKIWISEVMLQQTRVSYMVPIFKTFIEKFPTIFSLANSRKEEVLKYWKGLGYYNRAINLHKGANYLIKNFEGKFPKELSEILKVPGIGDYTARAILSIAFNLPFAVLDGNVKRVLSRYFMIEDDINLVSTHKKLQKYADNFLNIDYPSLHNEAVMELGATICFQPPYCLLCPLQNSCKSYQSGKQNELPKKLVKTKKIKANLTFIFIKKKEKVLLINDKKSLFFKKIPFLPFIYKDSKKTVIPDYLKNIEYEILTNKIKHSITKYDLTLEVAFYKDLFEIEKIAYLKPFFVEIQELENFFVSSITKKILKILNET